ncbi:hypothetical protein [Tautonia sociabilis]|uniref:Topoisomerase 6 subunit A/Spo11 TOPRIM domain-containing protein n=1 Tax=Tautonia sociabilis TaxID=2080755 RepID=A0A432MC69_9BACT|nr:hypothetical protein [Tautonia sociabilis]RUL81412.1 hypothetical protein TsocGM_25145 [Tautonia sociabilis]
MSMYQRDDWTLFRTLETLGQKAGVPPWKLAALVAKELTDNALDEKAACRVGLLDGNGFFVEDDGEGIGGTDDEIAELFSISRPLRSSKLLRRPTRGALGNGLRVVTGAVYATGGTLDVATRHRILRLLPQDDGTTRVERVGPYDGPGTRVEVRLGPSVPVTRDSLAWANQAIDLSSGESRYTGETSPHWYNSDSFFELLLAAGGRTVRAVIEDFDGCTGPKASKIAADFKGRAANSLSLHEAESLLRKARGLARVVKPERLGGLGPRIEDWPRSYAKVTGAYLSNATRGTLQAEIPFVVEVYAEVSAMPRFGVSVNRTPVPAELGFYHEKEAQWIFGCGLDMEFKVGRRPLHLWLNVDSRYMPITTDGKSPDFSPMDPEIRAALEKAIKRAKRQVSEETEEKGPTTKDVILDSLEDAISKASGEGTYRFSIRQLFYAVRPYVIENLGTEPEYNYFSKVITEYEGTCGEIEGMYRDPRGVVYHPHTGEEIQLGTIQVERYRRPPYTFNKVLYCEEEGIFPILRETKWPERNDCALMTSKGFASRAARDLLDLLGETVEELYVFCIHDADGPGTMIYQALAEATKARPGRKVRIINLGLGPYEAEEMDLQVESVSREGHRRIPVADYVDEEWAEWLQSHRVELNAMTTPQLLEWLDRKFADYVGKVIPPKDVLSSRLERDVRARLERQLTEEAVREARIPERIEAEFARRDAAFRAVLETIGQQVEAGLAEEPLLHWTGPVGRVADSIVLAALPDAGTTP